MEPLRQTQRIHDDWKYERNQYNDSEHEIEANDIHNNNIPYSPTLKSHKARSIACNGDCGSKIAQIINDIIQSTFMYNKSYRKIQI